MNKDQVTGAMDDLKGKVKEEWGKVTNDPATQASGLKDQVKGKVEKGYGDAKDAVNKTSDDAADEAAAAANRHR